MTITASGLISLNEQSQRWKICVRDKLARVSGGITEERLFKSGQLGVIVHLYQTEDEFLILTASWYSRVTRAISGSNFYFRMMQKRGSEVNVFGDWSGFEVCNNFTRSYILEKLGPHQHIVTGFNLWVVGNNNEKNNWKQKLASFPKERVTNSGQRWLYSPKRRAYRY